jgi:hypothetical protein
MPYHVDRDGECPTPDGPVVVEVGRSLRLDDRILEPELAPSAFVRVNA